MGDIVRINMADLSVKREAVPSEWAGYTGRALTTAIVFKEAPPKADPLGPENVLVFSPGMLGGTTAPNGGRISVGAKSPLTGGIKESNSGGQAAHSLARVGISALIIEGAPSDASASYVISIAPDGSVEIVRRDELKGMRNYALIDTLAPEQAEGARFAVMSVGPAGEMGLKSAGIAFTDPKGYPNRFAGRGGLGAVMGSKGVKAIVVVDTGLKSLDHADKEAFNAASRKFSTALKEHPVTGEALPTYGTQVLPNIINEAGGYPTRNFSDGQFEGVEAISGETQREVTIERGGSVKHGCHSGCVIQCSRYWYDKDGQYKTKGMEYESVWSLGADCGIDDLDIIGELDRECGELGIDTIEAGATLAVYMESGAIAFGDGPGALKALKEVGEGTELGRNIGNGAEATGLAYGVSRIPVVKHQAMPAYDPRPIQGIGVTYATSTQGADHTAGYAITSNVLAVGGTVDPLAPEGQVELSQGLQIATAMLDSFGLCIFVAFAVLDKPEAFEAIYEMVSAHTGDEWTADSIMDLGKEVLAMERLYNEAAGFGPADDRLPAFMLTEPLPPHNVVFTVPDAELDKVFDFVPEVAAAKGWTLPG